jgi:hypothetical protein
VSLLLQSVVDEWVPVVAGAGGLVLLSGAVAAALAALHRWYARSRVPGGLAVLAGAGAVALVLNTMATLGNALVEDGFSSSAALANVAVFLGAAVAASAGVRVGDRVGAAVATDDVDVRQLVRAVGRTVTVRLPEEIEDMPEFDPVAPATKAELAGAELRFPGRLTVDELRERLVDRLRSDYGVGRVDLDLSEDGEVTYLALGARAAGLGPTLTPGSAAVAIHADPANGASAGDLVQVYDGTPPERVATGEVRGTAGDVVTLAVDEDDAAALDDTTRYRLITLPNEPRADHAFASVLRAADETMGLVTVGEGSPLVGTTVGALAPTVVAVRGAGGVEPIPSRSRALAADDAVWVVARPDAIRRLEAAAAGEGPVPTAERAAADDD